MIQSKLLLKYKNIRHCFFNKSESQTKTIMLDDNKNIVTMQQVHGTNIEIVKKNINNISLTDGLISNKKIDLCVKTADCMPLLIYDPNKKIIAAVHIGWKGLSNGIIANLILRMKSLNSDMQDIIIVIGPHIMSCCYNVSADRVQLFKNLYQNENIIIEYESQYYLDLSKAAKFSFLSLGIDKNNIDILDICTYCNKLYPSYRRDGGHCGRMLSIIGMI
jgi:polyphenol oxidase